MNMCTVGSEIRVPNVPMAELRDYLRLLCQMHAIMEIVPPGHAWFDVHMAKLQRAGAALKEALPGADAWALPHLVRKEATRLLTDYNAGESVFISVLTTLEQGMPHVDNDNAA